MFVSKSRRTISVLILTLTMLTLITCNVFADVPRLINYQGRLSDSGGNYPDTVVSLVFSIYDSDMTEYWQEEHGSVTVTNGLFNVTLGTYVDLYAELFTEHSNLLLGIQVGEDDEIEPYTQLISAPFAFHALHADTADYVTGG